MNIHEYQAKALFEKYGVPVPKGAAAKTPEEFINALADLPEGPTMVKSQIHAGGRGKGTFTDGYKGGVKFCKTKTEAKEVAARMLGNTLVTIQTGPAGRKVQTIYFTVASDIKKEYYLAILLDRAASRPVIVASTEGGVEIEKVAHDTPEKIVTVHVDPTVGLAGYQSRELAYALGLEKYGKATIAHFGKLMSAFYELFVKEDCSLCEINPLVVLKSGEVVALDAKVDFDDNAEFRHPEWDKLRDEAEEDPTELEAKKAGLNYVSLDGNVGCLVNGAGLAMSTMDIIKHVGAEQGVTPANFLDVGGGATQEQVTKAFKMILKSPKVRAIFVNIFGGIMKCDVVATGVVAAAKELGLAVPLVVRLEGTNVELGRKILNESGLKIEAATTMADGARKIVAAVVAGGVK